MINNKNIKRIHIQKGLFNHLFLCEDDFTREETLRVFKVYHEYSEKRNQRLKDKEKESEEKEEKNKKKELKV